MDKWIDRSIMSRGKAGHRLTMNPLSLVGQEGRVSPIMTRQGRPSRDPGYVPLNEGIIVNGMFHTTAPVATIGAQKTERRYS